MPTEVLHKQCFGRIRMSLYVRTMLKIMMIVTGWRTRITRGSVSSTQGLGPTMTARGQRIGISIGMLPQTLIMSRLDQLSQLGARV
jgi:hypothetical protein